QPGVDEWGNATADLVYDTTYASGAIKINTSKWAANATYYLYFPKYICSGAGPNADSFVWAGPYKVGVASVKVIATQAGVSGSTTFDALDTGGSSFSFNRSGMWIFDTQATSHWGNDTSTYAGYIWVNSSTEYVISSVADVLYNSSGSKTITVDTGDDAGCMISIIAPDNSTVYHKWRATSASGAIGIKGNFSMVGDYTVRAYRDFDEDTSVYLYADGDSGWKAYDNTYGSNTSFPAAPSNSADYYNHTHMGPFDPPEKNATEVTFTVNIGEPNIVLTNATNVYWGFKLRVDVNVTDDDGIGITLGTVRLKKGSTYIANGTHAKIWINETAGEPGNYTIEIPRYVGGANDWANLANGTWRVVFNRDISGDGTDEWNNSKKISFKSSSPPVRINIDNDDVTPTTDKKVNVPAYSGNGDDAADTVNISFTIMGRSISDDQGRAYYGDDAGEDQYNITISGDMLYPIHRYSGSLSGTLLNNGDGTWNAVVTPNKPGGTITIAVNWPGSNNGSASQTIEIVNGTQITTSVDIFTVGQHINLTITIKDMDGDPIKSSRVYLFWKGGGASSDVNDTTGNNKAGNGQNGEYTFWIKSDEQGSTAPKNITIAASWPGQAFWGYANVLMEKDHNMMVNCTPTTAYAGDAVEYDIDVSLDNGENPKKTGLTVALYNETGSLVTDADDAWSRTGAYDINDEEIPLTGGMYYLFAYNDTHDSRGHNATIIVTPYSVASSPSVLAWLVDTSTNMTFQVTPAGNGTLYVENMSTTPNASSAGET
ncbi:MAG: hypothetical protein KAR64_03045, partial [Thermoplasmatales archaeon]|nr:hypothetical protein [Thermoplasmatales archaeon]